MLILVLLFSEEYEDLLPDMSHVVQNNKPGSKKKEEKSHMLSDMSLTWVHLSESK